MVIRKVKFSIITSTFISFLILGGCINIPTDLYKSSFHEQSKNPSDIKIIAHRGASGYLPEHTKEATILAFMQGADFIEQDLVVSKDDHLIVLHDTYLELVTNVENVFPHRKREDGKYYVVDFTLAELRQLSVHERTTNNGEKRYENRYQGFAHFSITTFSEQVELIRELNRQFNKNTGVYPELKNSAWHGLEGKDIVSLFYQALKDLSLNSSGTQIYIQSFNPSDLIRLKNEFKLDLPLVQLIAENSWSSSTIDFDSMRSTQGLMQVKEYADAIGPWIPQVYNFQRNEPTKLIALAKQAGLKVHPYTLREDANSGVSTKLIYEALRFNGIDGIFTDHVMPYMFQINRH